MKILFLTPWYPYESMGVNHGIFIRDQAEAVSHDHEVMLIASKIDYGIFSWCSYKSNVSSFQGVQEHRLTINKSLPVYNQLNYFIITFLYSYRVARRFKPDIIHGNIGYPGAFWAWVLSVLCHRPFIVTEHSGKLKGHFRSVIQRCLTIFPMRRAAKLISVSEYAAQDVFQYVKRKPVVIGNIIDFRKFDSVKTRGQSEVCHIGFLGVLDNDKKGLDLLLRSLPAVTGKYVLHIGGGGKLLEDYKKMAFDLGVADSCEFQGFVLHWQVPEFLNQLNFFVNTSRFESFGMAIVEAMSVGLPVVVTDSGGPRDYVNNKNGVIVPNGNEAVLADALTRMIANYPSYDAHYIRKFARDNYSDKMFRKRINQIYNELKP